MKSRFIFVPRWLKLSRDGRCFNRSSRSQFDETHNARQERRGRTRSRLSRIVVAPLLVLALAVGLLTVDTAVDPEPASAGWEWTTVYDTYTKVVCTVTPWVATAFGYAGAKGTVKLLTKSVTKFKPVKKWVNIALPGAIPVMVLVNELAEYVETEIWYRACKGILTEIPRRAQVWVEDTAEAVENIMRDHNPNCFLGRPVLVC